MKLKTEFLSNLIFHPTSGQSLNVDLIDPAEYEYLYSNGYDYIFEVEEKSKDKKNAIPKQ